MERIREIIEEIKKVYLEERAKNNTPFLISFSAGKDSTALLALFFKALLELPKEVRQLKNYLLFADTEMELPYYSVYAKQTLQKIKKFARENNINIEIDYVTPELKNKFFNLVIGKGQLLPRSDFRWCTQRLKTKPMGDFLKEKFKNIKIIALNGARKEESDTRANTLENSKVSHEVFKHLKIPAKDKAGWQKYSFTPMEDLSIGDIWNIIKNCDQSWIDYEKIKEIYLLGTNPNEQVDEDALETRYGCWFCPVVSRDKTLENVAARTGSKLFKSMLEFRDFMLDFKRDWMYSLYIPLRDIYNHRFQRINFINLKKIKIQRKGMVSPGGFTLDIRKLFFNKLVSLIEENLDEVAPEFILTKEDVVYIQECWLEEGDIELTAFKRIRNIYPDLKLTEEKRRLLHFFEIARDAQGIRFENLNDKRVFYQEIKKFFKKYYKSILNVEYDSTDIVEHFLNIENELLFEMSDEGFYFGDNFFDQEKIDPEIVYQEWHQDKISFFKFLKKVKKGEIELSEKEKRFIEIYAYKDENLFYQMEIDELEKNLKKYPFLSWLKVMSEIKKQEKEKGLVNFLEIEEIPLSEKISFIENY